MRVIELTERHRLAWDRLAAVHSASGFMQSWTWSEFKELEGYSVLRLGVFEGEELLGGALCYGSSFPAEAALWAAPDGPLLEWESGRGETAWKLLVGAFRRSPRARGAAIFRIEPRLGTLPAVLRGLPRAPSDLVPFETLEIALGPESQMLQAMKPKGRYNTRLAGHHGVEVQFMKDPSAIEALYSILEATALYQDFYVEPRSFFVNLARTLLSVGVGEIVLARCRGMLLAAAFVVYHGDRVTFLYGGHVPLFANRMASTKMHWEIMKRAAALGFRYYDLYGYVGPECVNHPYFGFSRFKEKLGGSPVRRIGSRDVIFYDRLAVAAVEVLARIGDNR